MHYMIAVLVFSFLKELRHANRSSGILQQYALMTIVLDNTVPQKKR